MVIEQAEKECPAAISRTNCLSKPFPCCRSIRGGSKTEKVDPTQRELRDPVALVSRFTIKKNRLADLLCDQNALLVNGP
jgi:hypothetical protein